jgi:hypothetical protein
MPIDESKKIYREMCYETKTMIETNCSHLYCLDCITKCPLCRQQITHIYTHNLAKL